MPPADERGCTVPRERDGGYQETRCAVQAAAEVFDDEDRVRVRLEAPGMHKDDLNLTVLDNCLLVRGEKHFEDDRSDGRYRITERAYGVFERSIPLPAAVDSDRAEARYEHGVLRVELPKTAPQGHRRVTVG